MQKFIFRGKLKHDSYDKSKGDWFVSTGLIHQTDYYGMPVDRYFIVDGEDTLDYDIGDPYEVEPDTVGQFIGRRDINGKKIFTGDIVNVIDHKSMGACLVDWTETFGYALLRPVKHPDWLCNRLNRLNLEVIGNKWDDPELLG